MRWFLDLVYRTADRTCGLRVTVDEPEPPPGEQAARLARPLIVLSRHAGPGDSLLLVHHLLSVYGRRPRVVMKATLQLDPTVDVLANRLPNVFLPRARAAGERISPSRSGGSPRGLTRRARWSSSPRAATGRRGAGTGPPAAGRARPPDLAHRAGTMPNVLPPRAGGALAAIAACPAADVIFVAHAGLDRLVSVRDVWRSLPTDLEVRASWWRVPAGRSRAPPSHDAQVSWLYDWWARIDAWITQNRPTAAPPALSPEVSVRGQSAPRDQAS